MALKRQEHPFLHPLWRRVALVGFCAIWTAWEYYNGDELWSTLTLCLTVYGAWTYLYKYEVPKPEE